MVIQEQKNSASKKVEDFKLDNQRFMSDMNKQIQDGKVAHVDLTNEVCELILKNCI